MIKNITKLSFAEYGRIAQKPYHAIPKEKDYKAITKMITSFDLHSFYIDHTHDTIMDIEGGTALLYVYIPGHDSVTFFLDKCVMLAPNVFYKVTPVYSGCKINITYNFKATRKQTKNTRLDFSPDMKSIFKIDKIYTLFYQEFDASFTYKGEKHDFWELTYVDQGELLTRIDDKPYTLQQGDFIFYAPNQYHTQKNNASSPISFLTITFDLDSPKEDIFKHQVFSCSQELREILEQIVHEKNEYGLYSADLIICYLKEFIITFMRSLTKKNTLKQLHSSMQVNTNNTLVNKALAYIYGHINEKITIDMLAQEVSISPSYLSRIFKHVMGVTIVDYMTHYRLEKSKAYIKSTELSLTQIAEILGFGSIHYFSKQFKKHYDISPLIYSKSIKK
ncbi:helix-turn-helix transcriptional regulator [Vallitalea pronyensis]|uniref:Helix-turn-helix transcriptional regulator n=1 Tax=Vallitalea pronyensis TaxID=1348613 RepID=A0A8J8MNS8_9FIRM|nr:AraC family transcriptional regulator [Vallitalea pronyensis]QUI25140.1 helix-turn-helix transcriptional regulator [Vallitalea pronyensis]